MFEINCIGFPEKIKLIVILFKPSLLERTFLNVFSKARFSFYSSQVIYFSGKEFLIQGKPLYKMNGMLKESTVVKEYDFNKPDIHEIEDLFADIIKDCRNKYFHTLE